MSELWQLCPGNYIGRSASCYRDGTRGLKFNAYYCSCLRFASIDLTDPLLEMVFTCVMVDPSSIVLGSRLKHEHALYMIEAEEAFDASPATLSTVGSEIGRSGRVVEPALLRIFAM